MTASESSRSDSDNGPDPGSDHSPSGARDHGLQPLAQLMTERGLAPKDLVAAAADQINHKMVGRAMKGRQLTPNAIRKVTAAFCAASGEVHGPEALFGYVTAKGQVAREADGGAPESSEGTA